MSYHDLPAGNADVELGRKIYMDALEDRRGFRYDQLGIEDVEIWAEIFEEMGKAARVATSQEGKCDDEILDYKLNDDWGA